MEIRSTLRELTFGFGVQDLEPIERSALTMVAMAGHPRHYLRRTRTSHARAVTHKKAGFFGVCFAAAPNYASFEAWKSSFAK